MLIAPALAVVLIGGGTLACTGSSGTGSRSAAAAPTTASARALLQRHSAALLQRSRPRYLADLDPSTAAAGFRSEQAADFDNLAEVPLASWSWTVGPPIRDSTARAEAVRTYRAPVLLLQVSFRYALRSVDAEPSPHAEYLVFVRRSGRTYLAGDDALGRTGAVGWVGPWHYGPLAAAAGARSLVLGPRSDRTALQRLAGETDAAVAAVTQVWGTGWRQRVAVVVPATEAEFGALSGSGSSDVAAAAVTDGIDAVSGVPYGQRVVLDPAQFSRLSQVGRGIVLRHEITHLASAAQTADTTPRWLVEGFADYVGNLSSGQPVRTAAAELAAQVRQGHLPSALPSDTALTTPSSSAMAYEQAWLACRLIAAKAGRAGLVRFYRLVGTAVAPPSVATADAFALVLHESPGAFVRQWRGYLQTVLS